MPLPILGAALGKAAIAGLAGGISGLIGGIIGKAGARRGIYDPVQAAGGTQAAIQHDSNQAHREMLGQQIDYQTRADAAAATRSESSIIGQEDRAYRRELQLRNNDYVNQAALMVLQDRLETARLARSMAEANARNGVPAAWSPRSQTGTNIGDRFIRSIHSTITGRDPGDIDWGSMMDRAYQDMGNTANTWPTNLPGTDTSRVGGWSMR